METLVQQLTKEIIDLKVDNAKLTAEVNFLRRHIDIMNTVFQKPVMVTLTDQQIDHLAQAAATYIKAATDDPNKMN